MAATTSYIITAIVCSMITTAAVIVSFATPSWIIFMHSCAPVVTAIVVCGCSAVLVLLWPIPMGIAGGYSHGKLKCKRNHQVSYKVSVSLLGRRS